MNLLNLFKQTTRKFNIGDKVILISAEVKKVYIVYSYTQYIDGRYTYMIWLDDEYLNMDEWQIERHEDIAKVGFNINL